MGGSAQEWSAEIDDSLVGGSPIALSVVLTNFNADSAIVGYEVVVRVP